MYSTLFTTTLIFALAVLRVRADFTVYTPVLTQCQPATLTWDSTTGPYDILIVSSADPCGDALEDLGEIASGNSYQWPQVAISAGTQVTISIMDSTGGEGWSGSITVQSSSDSSCLTSANTPNTPTQNTPAANSPLPQNPTHSSSSSSSGPTPTVVGAANNGILGNGSSMVRISSVAVFFTALGALAALL
ncbi:hypothetical protein BJ322DRAFT_728823 [Thelephora terrestris]|jgi:hypothetical protein|uniref:Uncharacterized protein n=1 Tax=Thelephora terrestris TaxID=56493 RepID=A0A9P6HIL8_9AGAM|nr:hypothetical protein BJ322DRAFT_728823 [Thelephora terrestris]